MSKGGVKARQKRAGYGSGLSAEGPRPRVEQKIQSSYCSSIDLIVFAVTMEELDYSPIKLDAHANE
jgi:hypothetical protein